jgi:hypothetical protein
MIRGFDVLTVWEHLQFIAATIEARGRGRGTRLLEEWISSSSGQAGGAVARMRQKVAVLRVSSRAPVLLFDEPSLADPGGIRAMKASGPHGPGGRRGDDQSARAGGRPCTHLLILHRGRRVFFGRMDEASAAFPGLAKDASLETVFFRAMEGL